MKEMLNTLRSLVERHATGFSTPTAIPGVELRTGYGTSGPRPDMYQPMVCFVLQGAKCATVGDCAMTYQGASCMVSSVALPVTSQIVAASPDTPYLALSLALNPSVVASVLLEAPAQSVADASFAVGVSPLTEELVEPMVRMLRLLDTPSAIAALAPLIECEIVYRLLEGPQAPMLRQIAGANSRFAQIRRANACLPSPATWLPLPTPSVTKAHRTLAVNTPASLVPRRAEMWPTCAGQRQHPMFNTTSIMAGGWRGKRGQLMWCY